MISRIIFWSAQPLRIRPARLGRSRPPPAGARALLGRVQHALGECPDQLLGVDRPDALDHAGAQVSPDALERGRRGSAQKGGLELVPVGPVVDPRVGGLDELAGADRGCSTEHGDQIALAADLDPQHAEATVRVVKGHPLDQASDSLSLRPRRDFRFGHSRQSVLRGRPWPRGGPIGVTSTFGSPHSHQRWRYFSTRREGIASHPTNRRRPT